MPWSPPKEKRRNILADKEYDLNRRKVSPELSLAKKIRSSKEWQNFRSYFLDKYPLCSNPFNEHKVHDVIEAKQVHHIKGIATHPESAFDELNCKGVCTHCHSRIEAMVRSGKEIVYAK